MLIGLERICPNCFGTFRSCEHCWRNQKYCSPTCSQEGRRRNRRNTEKRYAATEKGRENRRRRQKTFRNRQILKVKVTDHSPRTNTRIVKTSTKQTNEFSNGCDGCRMSIQIIIHGEDDARSEENYHFSFIRHRSKAGKF